MEKELLIPYALKGNRMVYIDDVDRGLDCGCICPKCRQPLIARQGDVRIHHFAHCNGEHQCVGAYEVALYRLAIQILKDEQRVMAPKYKDVVSAELIHFKHVEIEEQGWGISIRPDVVGTCEDGSTICIGLRCATTADETKFSRLAEQNTHCMEIDIRECPMNESKLRTFLLESVNSRKWLNHPEYERIYQKKQQERETQRHREEEELAREYERKKGEQGGHRSGNYPSLLDITHIDRPREEAEDSKKKEVFEEVPRPTISPLQDGPLKDYYESLHPHDIFKEYTEETTVVVNFGLSYSRRSVLVIHVNHPYKSVRLPFHLSRITIVDGTLKYEYIGAYTTENMAEWRQLKLKNDVSKPQEG